MAPKSSSVNDQVAAPTGIDVCLGEQGTRWNQPLRSWHRVTFTKLATAPFFAALPGRAAEATDVIPSANNREVAAHYQRLDGPEGNRVRPTVEMAEGET